MNWTKSGQWLFCYGTLQDNAVYVHAARVAPTPLIRATLFGWRRVTIPRASYPGAVPDAAGARILGGLRLVRSKREWHALDAYEGPQYRRVVCKVRADAGDFIAFVYQYQVPFG